MLNCLWRLCDDHVIANIFQCCCSVSTFWIRILKQSILKINCLLQFVMGREEVLFCEPHSFFEWGVEFPLCEGGVSLISTASNFKNTLNKS